MKSESELREWIAVCQRWLELPYDKGSVAIAFNEGIIAGQAIHMIAKLRWVLDEYPEGDEPDYSKIANLIREDANVKEKRKERREN